MDVAQALTSLAQTFTIIAPATPSPTAPNFAFGLTPPVGMMPNLLELISNLPTSTVTEIRESPITIEWLTKDVRFTDADILHDATVGGMPVSSFVAPVGGVMPPNLSAATFGPVSPPGVPGVLGSLTGNVPIPVQVTRTPELPEILVSVTIRWRVRDESGNIIPNATGTTGEVFQRLPTNYSDITAIPPSDLANLLTLAFPVLFTELLAVPRPLARRTIEAAIRLEVVGLGIATDWVELPAVTVELPVIGIPTVLVLTTEPMFGGEVLVIVPTGSPLETVNDVSTMLLMLAGSLAPLAGAIPTLGLFLSTFVPGSLVMEALTSPSHTPKFAKADTIPFLRDIVWAGGINNWVVNFNGEDSMDSLAFVGPPNRQVECFNAWAFSDGEGQLNVSTGPELIVIIETLRSAAPPSNPPGRIGIPRPPGGARWFLHGISTFGDELSSLRFSWA